MSDFASNPAKVPPFSEVQEGLARYEVTRQTTPWLPPGHPLALPPRGRPHTRTHADHTYTAQTHARAPTVKYMYRATRLDIYTEREMEIPAGVGSPRLSACSAQLSALYLAPMPLPEKQLPLSPPPSPRLPVGPVSTGRRHSPPPLRPPAPHDDWLPRERKRCAGP